MERYVRFCSNLPGSRTRAPLGVFHAASKITEADAIDPWSAGRAEEVLRWFNAHLTAPHLDASQQGALFWFRGECRDMVRRLWELVHVLRENDVSVELVRTRNPGRVCYADAYQIAAIPWRQSLRRC